MPDTTEPSVTVINAHVSQDADAKLPTLEGESRQKPHLTGAERIAAAKAKTSTAAVAEASTAAAEKPGEQAAVTVDDKVIASASAKVEELAAAKAAVVKDDDFATAAAKAKELISTDPLKAMELLGIPIGKAVEQAMGTKPADTEVEQLRVEIKRLQDERAADLAKANAAAETAKSEAARNVTIAAIISDKAYPNITSVDHVKAALKEAAKTNLHLVADFGRPLNQTEADRLVAFHLKKYNDAAALEQAAASIGNHPLNVRNLDSLKGSVVQAPDKKRRTWQQIKGDLKAKAAARR